MLASLIACTTLNAATFKLSQEAQLTLRDNVKRDWLTPVANPLDEKQYFLTSKKGELFILDDNILRNDPAINMAQLLGANTEFSLTAFSLHPNFSLVKEQGYRTFYTAHTEPHKETTAKRLTDGNASYTFTYDAVITEWLLPNDANDKTQPPRELLRIAVPSNTDSISQLRFNPNVTKWQDNFGQLYAVIPASEQYKTSPLYSGAILRIHPIVSGLHDYTVPTSNPFTKNINISNELLLIGAQKISHITWYKGNSEQIAVTHEYNQKTKISLAEHIHDWRNTPPKEVVFTEDAGETNSTHFYQGNLLATLSGKLLFFRKNNKEWELHTPHPKGLKQSALSKTASQAEWAISAYQIPVNNHIGLFNSHNHELLLLDYADNILFSIKSNNVALPAPVIKKKPKLSPTPPLKVEVSPQKPTFKLPSWVNFSNLKRFAIIASACLGILIVLFFSRKIIAKTAQRFTRQKFARFDFNDEKNQVVIFRKEQGNASKAIEYSSIKLIEISLNSEELLKLNDEETYGFSNEHERLLTKCFKDEYQNKMFDDSVRTIELLITDKDNNQHFITPYIRKGNQRLTHGKYFDIVAALIELCWKINSALHPESDEHRATSGTQNLDVQARPSKNKIKKKPASNNPTRKEFHQVIRTHESQLDIGQEEVVDALDKLVSMRKQGLLSEQEFTLAKEKLLTC